MYQILQGLAFIHKHGRLCFSYEHSELEPDSVCVSFLMNILAITWLTLVEGMIKRITLYERFRLLKIPVFYSCLILQSGGLLSSLSVDFHFLSLAAGHSQTHWMLMDTFLDRFKGPLRGRIKKKLLFSQGTHRYLNKTRILYKIHLK